jgi:DNA-binding CsgD family transcriptional regulator/tetratricopeptide (TPR) repeat protein
VGEAGAGKTRLANEVVQLAVERDMTVLRGRAVPGSNATAYRPLSEAFAPTIPDRIDDAGLALWLPALDAIVPIASRSSSVDVTMPIRGEALVRLLGAVCPRGGVLVLEDLHWADIETAAIVEHLSDHIERAPVLCVATVRSEEESPAGEVVHRIASRRAAQVLHLPRLNDSQVAAMVHSCTGGAGSDAIDRVIALAEGNPFLVEEMLVSPGLPPTFADAVRARLAELPEHDQRVLLVASAYGRDFDWRLLPAATGLTEEQVVDALERGVRAQLLTVDADAFRFRHALTAEATYQSVVPPRRQAAASAALEALDHAWPDLPVHVHEVAARLAERAGDLARAGALDLTAGDEALQRGALRTAVVALERAVELLGPSDARDLAGERLVDALAMAGRIDDALAASREVIDRLDQARAARVHLRLADAATTAARWDLADAQLEAASSLVDSVTSPALQGELAMRDAALALERGDLVRAATRGERALALARDVANHEDVCAALQLLGRCARRSSLDEAERWFREALAVADEQGLALWRMRALHEIGTIALLDRSTVDELIEAQTLAESLGALATAAILDIEIAAGSASAHDLERAAFHGAQAVRRGTELGMDLVVAYGWLHVAGSAALSRDQARAGEAGAAARAAAPGNHDIDGLVVGVCELLPALFADGVDRALEVAARVESLMTPTAPPAFYRSARPLLLAVLGQPEAIEVAEDLEAAGLGVSTAVLGGLTMTRAIVAGRSDPPLAHELAMEADRQLAYTPLWHAIVTRLGAAAAAADGWSMPEGALAGAEQWLRGHGYETLADACVAIGDVRTEDQPLVWAQFGVTPREADVLALVIEGCSNREIADRLHLSVRTVEKHVESLLRKTNTSSRTKLARVAADT